MDFVPILATTIRLSAPMVIACLGITLNERAGIINLSVEGTILLSAMAAFATAFVTGSLWLGFGMALLVGAGMALLVAFGGITLRQDQVAVGFVLALLAEDVSSFLGTPYIQQQGPFVRRVNLPILSDLPVLGELFFKQDWVTYFSFVLIGVVWFFMYKTQAGLQLRGIGERPEAAHARGANVNQLRFVYITVGGALIGLAGAGYSLATQLGWSNRHTGGLGWIALSIVIFGGWDPLRVAFGAFLFGLLRALAPNFQNAMPFIPSQVFPVLPFPLMILTLVLLNPERLDRVLAYLPGPTRRWLSGALRSNPPAALGTRFDPP
jgi:simple sugar transport system permease protein